MAQLHWLVWVLCMHFGAVGADVCSSTVFSKDGLVNGAPCPDPLSLVSIKSCQTEGHRMLGWSLSSLNNFIVYFTIECCPNGLQVLKRDPEAATKIYGDTKCSALDIDLDTSSNSANGGANTIYSNTGDLNTEAQYWGYRGVRIGYDANGYVSKIGFYSINRNEFQTFSPRADTDTKSQNEYYCPAGTSVVGLYYTVTDNRMARYTGVQCLPRNCPAGQYSVSYGQSCAGCEVGKYNGGTYATSCTQCLVGVPSTAEGWDFAALTYSSSGGATDSCQYTCNAKYGKGILSSGCENLCCKCLPGYHSPSGTCLICPAGSYASGLGNTACTPCEAGKTQPNAGSASCSFCQDLAPVAGYYQVACTATSNTQNLRCTGCLSGKYLSPDCGGTQPPACVNCEAGKIQTVAIAAGYTGPKILCDVCAAGLYQSGIGKDRCDNCKNPTPANGAYAPWTAPSVNGTLCPTQCNAGFGWNGTQCARCAPGTYAPGGLVPAACASCLALTRNAYWVTPVAFNRSWSGCPWDCNAGYYRTPDGNCAGCAAGTFSQAVRLVDTEPPNACRACSVCGAGQYSSVPCNASRDTVCSPCRTGCFPGYYLTQCTPTTNSLCAPCRASCAPGQFMASLCAGASYEDTVLCLNCSSPAACVSGLYMPPGQCPGNTLRDAACVVCRSVACPFGTYQRGCSLYNDTSCAPYTQCAAGQATLRNRGLTNDGVCLPCTDCSAYGLQTALGCSQYQDTLCDGTACSGASPCVNLPDRNFFCNLDGYGAAQASRTTAGVCGMCPDGYSSDGLYCYECPWAKTCSRTGAVQCQGQVAIGAEPWCDGEYAQPTGAACPFTADPTRVVARSTFLRPNGNCAPYFGCAPGYFKHFSSVGIVTCDVCDTHDIPVNYAWFSEGLSPNDPASCLYECVGRQSWPSGGCYAINQTSYIPKNTAGYYDDGSGAMKACPIGWTSQAGLATAATDCVLCFAPANTLGDPCYAWTCQSGLLLKGGLCFDPGQCPSSTAGYTTVLGVCVPTGLPWNQPGYQKTQGVPGAPPDVLVSQGGPAPPVNDTVSATVQDASNRTLVFYSLPYGRSKRHWLAVNTTTSVPLPGRVCSAAALVCQGRQYVVVAFCNASFLAFLDLSLASPTPRVLIGASTPGYREGFKADARFERVLHVASEAGRSSLFVADTLNCAVRSVSIPTLPGDFATRSYLVHGYTAAICSTVPTAILYPGRLFPVLGGTYFLFPAGGGLYQLDAPTRSVVQVLASSKAPAWMPDLSLLQSVALAANSSALVLAFASTSAVLAPSQQRCDAGFTSVAGGACTVSCSTDANYVDLESGACLPCYTRSCLPGEAQMQCTPTSPVCVPCPALEPFQGRYQRIYNEAGSCALSNTLFLAPCPIGYYLSSAAVRGFPVCSACPMFSTTASDGSTSIEQCRCYEGAVKSAGGLCEVRQIYELPALSRCPFGTYPRGAFERCSSCRLDPFVSCDFGLYPLSNGSCAPCIVPNLAVPRLAGRAVNDPKSCGFDCPPGYYPHSSLSYQTQCQPCTNAPNVSASGAEYYPVTNGQTDSPNGCTWGCRFPFKIVNGQCEPCTLVNPIHMSLPCKLPGWSVNSSAGEGVNGSLGALRYRMIQFNTSGYVVFSTNTTVDLLIVGGGGAGGAVPVYRGAGGGGGAGQVLFVYNVLFRANTVYPVTVGAGGTWASGAGTAAQSSSVAGYQALYGGNGGAGLGTDGSRGSIGASGGGTGSSGSSALTVGGGALAGFPGGGTTGAFMAGGGGGSGCIGDTSQACGMAALTNGNGDHSGAGGCGTVMWSNESATFFFPDASPELAGGGGGGSGWLYCPAGTSSAGGAGGGLSAPENSGGGGGGASAQPLSGTYVPPPYPFMQGGAGGSGVVVLRYVDMACVCGN